MEIKEVSNEPMTGENLLSIIEENVSENKKNKKSDNDEINEDEELDAQDFEDFEDFDEDEDENVNENKIGKKEIFMFIALGVSVVIFGSAVYMMLFQEKENTFDEVVPIPTQEIVQKQVQTVQQKNTQVGISNGQPEPLKPINQEPQQKEVVIQSQPIEPQATITKVNQKETIGKDIQGVKQEETINKPKTIHFVAKTKEDVGINQYAVIGNKAYLSSDLFEKIEFDVEDKEYSAKFNGKTRSFLKVIGEDSIYVQSEQVSDTYTAEK
jgi:hypothetical protein